MAYVVRNQVPMIMTFNEEEVEFICHHLAEAMDRAYKVYDFFSERNEEYEDE